MNIEVIQARVFTKCLRKQVNVSILYNFRGYQVTFILYTFGNNAKIKFRLNSEKKTNQLLQVFSSSEKYPLANLALAGS